MSLAPLAATLPRRSIQVSDNVNLNVIDVGEGQPILILPAWTNSAAEYARLIQELSTDHRVIAVDMRGHGQSDKTEHGYRIGRFAADLRAVLTALAVEDVTLVGHSLGCAVIWSYLDIFGSERIASLVFADQPSTQLRQPYWSTEEQEAYGCNQTAEELFAFCQHLSGPDGEALTRKMFTEIFTVNFPKEDLAWILNEILSMPRRHAATLMLDHAQRDWRDVIQSIRLPTLVVAGQASIFPVKCQDWISKQIPGAELVVFAEAEGGSHFMCLENPVGFADAIRLRRTAA
jgi:pimeloyl-ACP methyl ester carboxylesterase